MKGLTAAAFQAVTRLFHSASGIRLGEHKQALVTGRLQKLANEAGMPNLDDYVERLLNGRAPAEEMQRVIDRLTTNETYFFREPQHFKHLEALLRERAHRSEAVKLWSAASSSGEEAYSAAMVLSDTLGQRPWQVLGTDLSSAMVQAARRGLYPLDRARLLPAEVLKRHCRKGSGAHEGQLLVSAALRARVRFETANLMQALDTLPLFDVIFLRNVLIYFDPEAKALIVRNVLTRLKPEGVLYTGHAESLTGLKLPVRTLATACHTHA